MWSQSFWQGEDGNHKVSFHLKSSDNHHETWLVAVCHYRDQLTWQDVCEYVHDGISIYAVVVDTACAENRLFFPSMAFSRLCQRNMKWVSGWGRMIHTLDSSLWTVLPDQYHIMWTLDRTAAAEKTHSHITYPGRSWQSSDIFKSEV